MHVRAIVDGTRWGDSVVLCGSSASLGEWHLSGAWPLTTDKKSFPVWKATIPLNAQASECKLVIVRSSSTAEWEPLSDNRKLPPSTLTRGDSIVVSLCFGDPHGSVAVVPSPAPPPSLVSSTTSSAPITALHTAPSPQGPLAEKQPHATVAMSSASQQAAQAFSPSTAPQPRHDAAAARGVIGGPLEAIESMDASWPPSVASSLDLLVKSASTNSVLTLSPRHTPRHTPRNSREYYE